MKATDLMLGDWVTFADALKAGEFYPIKITSLTLPNRIAGYHPNPAIEGSDVYGEDDLVGIPLTTEILANNGFGYVEEDYVSGITHYYLGEPYVCYDMNLHIATTHGGFFWMNTNSFELHQLAFVHELQHALRLCGYIEIEIKL